MGQDQLVSPFSLVHWFFSYFGLHDEYSGVPSLSGHRNSYHEINRAVDIPTDYDNDIPSKFQFFNQIRYKRMQTMGQKYLVSYSIHIYYNFY